MNKVFEKIGDILFKGGLALLALSLVLLFLVFFPVAKEQLRFVFSPKNEAREVVLEENGDGELATEGQAIVAVDKNFSIVIPKIGANEKVVANVDPFNQGEYSKALKEGIAHAKGSGLPTEEGNVFLFAHSSGNFYQNSRLNTVFFLLGKLEQGDKFYVVYREEIYQYRVFDKKIVDQDELEYLQNIPGRDLTTLMTCWPPGTSSKRLLVMAEMEVPSDQ